MPSRLSDIVIEEISLVDRPANPESRVALFKRDIPPKPDGSSPDPAPSAWAKRDYSPEQRREMAKSGKALSDGSYPIEDVDDLKNAIKAFGRALNKARVRSWIVRRAKALGAEELIPETWVTKSGGEGDGSQEPDPVRKEAQHTEGASMPDGLDKELLLTLPVEVQEHIGSLEKALAEAGSKDASPPPTDVKKDEGDGKADDSGGDILKSAAPEIVALLKAAEDKASAADRRAAEAETLAKAERDKRLDREFFEKAASLKALPGSAQERATLMKGLSEASPTLYAAFEKLLQDADARLRESALLKVYGSDAEGEAAGKVTTLAKAAQAADKNLTFEQAVEKVLNENPALYDEYMRKEG